MARGPYGVGPRKRTWWRGYEHTKKTTRPRHYDDLNSSLSQSGQTTSRDNTRQHKTTQDIQTTTRTDQNPQFKKQKKTFNIRKIYFSRLQRRRKALVGAPKEGRLWDQLGSNKELVEVPPGRDRQATREAKRSEEQMDLAISTRGSTRTRSTSNKRSEDEQRTNETREVHLKLGTEEKDEDRAGLLT